MGVDHPDGMVSAMSELPAVRVTRSPANRFDGHLLTGVFLLLAFGFIYLARDFLLLVVVALCSRLSSVLLFAHWHGKEFPPR
jgi:hypothetical protein